ncbi:MAG: tRNA (N6-threonylcarbamoyladenosine(37)-N6)-methyltransferase TrmO [Bacteroidales bacterium]|nr:tRNA (N6-threonylcarbamoyladenosine(37)-N6)-methyltransferase TrmO [Bacteroidales bacterium]
MRLFFVYLRMKVIARIETDFPTKFGLPRQSRLINALQGTIVFEPEFRNVDAIRGLEDFSHIWLLWQFSEVRDEQCHPTVRPPRLGGNTHMGVFATRSPFRPNRIGLSCVEILGIETDTPRGPLIHVAGIDMMSGTPIFDIKPYIPYCDSIPDARSGFTAQIKNTKLRVDIDASIANSMSTKQLEAITEILASDPRPRYHDDENRIYGFDYAEWAIRFSVEGEVVKVVSIERKEGL